MTQCDQRKCHNYRTQAHSKCDIYSIDTIHFCDILKKLDKIKRDKEEMDLFKSNDEYLQSKIDSAKDTWKGVDVDEYMNMVRGRDC